jgi:hypothetical protein
MPKLLTKDQIETFWRDGCVFPIRVMSEAQAAELRARLEAFERDTGGPLKGALRHKSHLLFTWLAELVRNDTIVDAVDDLYGRNLLCWTTNFFIKEANNPGFVSWHQDSTYWGLDKPDVVTAWVALTPSNRSNGAMGFIPGTHSKDQIPHRDTFAKNNLLTRGQEVAVDVDEKQAVTIEARRPIRRTTGASASPSGTFPPRLRKSQARTVPPWCAAWTHSIISSTSHCPRATWIPPSSSCIARSRSGTRRSSIVARMCVLMTTPRPFRTIGPPRMTLDARFARWPQRGRVPALYDEANRWPS